MLMTSAYRDLAESAFIGDSDDQNNPLPSKPETPAGTNSHECALEELDFGDVRDNMEPMRIEGVMGHPEKEWSLRHVLGGGSLLGKSCHGALMLAGHPEELQKQGYLFGKHMSLAWQASIELQPFLLNQLPLGKIVCVVSPICIQQYLPLQQAPTSVWFRHRFCSTWSTIQASTNSSNRARTRSKTWTTLRCIGRSFADPAWRRPETSRRSTVLRR